MVGPPGQNESITFFLAKNCCETQRVLAPRYVAGEGGEEEEEEEEL